jgi:hypothetical protein
MYDATRKLIQNCSRVSAIPSTAMIVAHLVTREKYSDKQMEHIFEQVKGVVCVEDIIHPDKRTVSNLLEILDATPNHSYLALVHDPKSELLRVKRQGCATRKYTSKLRRETII